MSPLRYGRRALTVHVMRRASLVVCFSAAALAACFGGSSNPPSPMSPADSGIDSPVDGAAIEPESGPDVVSIPVVDATPETASPLDAAPEAASPGEAGPIVDAGAPDDALTLTCPGDLSSAAYVGVTADSGTPPASTGGAIPDGTYILNTYDEYESGTAGCSSPGDAAARMARGAITASAGMVRLDIQAPGNVEQCFVGASSETLQTDSGSFLLLFGSDGGVSFGFFYSVAPDGHTVSVMLGGSSCASVTTDGSVQSSGSSIDVGVFVRP
jgi:hypothetical protein